MYKILIKSGGRPQRPASRESSVFATARSLLSVQKDPSQDMGRGCPSCLWRRILSPLCTDTRFALWTGPRRVAPLAVALLRHRRRIRPPSTSAPPSLERRLPPARTRDPVSRWRTENAGKW